MAISQIGTNGIEDGAIVATDIAAGAVTQTKIANGVAGTGPAFSAYLGTNQSISASTWTKILYDTEEFDTNNNFTASRFTPTVAGYYQITAAAQLNATNWGGAVLVAIYKNGSVYKQSGLDTTGGSGGNTVINIGYIQCTSLVYCNGSTDYIEGYAYSNFSTSPIITNAIKSSFINGAMTRAA